MTLLDRRRTLALGAAAALTGCAPRIIAPAHTRRLDVGLLAHDFPALEARARPGALAMGVMNLADTQAWYWDTGRAFPLTGAVAAPVVAAALAQQDAGQTLLGGRIVFDDLDLSPPPSVIDQRWPDPPDDHSASIKLSGLATLALQQGDNTAIDVLMKQVGGPGAVNAFLSAKGVTGMRVDRYVRQLYSDLFAMPTFRAAWKDPAAFDAAREQVAPAQRQAAMDAFVVDPRDAATVPAALGFLAMLANGSLLSQAASAQLIAWMEGDPAGGFRSGLPAKARLARIAGATPTDLGFTAASAELAIATYPNGAQYALAAFLVGSTATDADRAALFADAAHLAHRASGQSG